MTRISNKKQIINKTKFDTLIELYNSIIENLENKFQIDNSDNFFDLVNFKNNVNYPIHNWVNYKEGYSSLLVEKIIRKINPSKEFLVLDPFCGVGTTNLVAQQLGYKSIGFDINPMASLATKVKTSFYSSNDLKNIKHALTKEIEDIQYDASKLPRVILSSFKKDALDQIISLKDFIHQVEDEKVRNFLNLGFISILEDCSIRIKDGNGIKIKPNKKYIRNVKEYFRLKCVQMIKDITRSNNHIEVNVISKSSIHYLQHYLKNDSVSLCIYSPPYANCFDYLEVYKLEVWLGGFVKVYQDFKMYRKQAMRSHVNSGFSHNFENVFEEVRTISELISAFNIWNKNIPDMIIGYFDDTNILLSKLYNALIKGGKVFIVVANSVYKGIIVPTDLLICEIAKIIGFKVKKIQQARRIRSSSQQIPEIRHNELMRESILELEK